MAVNLPASSQSASTYSFLHHRLRITQTDPSRTPVVLVACGSFSPITNLHLRMFEMALDFCKFHTDFEVMGGYISPVSDAYKKQGLANSAHRIRMCELAVDEQRAGWLIVDPWEALQPIYIPTAKVLDHFQHEINEVLGGAERPDGTRVPIRIVLLAGTDLIQTMSTPGLWSSDDLDHILRDYGAFIVERAGTDIDDALASLQVYRDNIYVIQQLIQNDVSSTKIRLFLRREMSVRYLIPDSVIKYIEEFDLYRDDGTSSIREKEKSKDKEGSGRTSPVISSSGSKS